MLLAGGAFLCSIRWQAWFGMPPEPEYYGDTLSHTFQTFVGDTVPGFYYDGLYWQDQTNPDTFSILLLGDIHSQMDSAQYSRLTVRHPEVDVYAQLGDWVERPYFYYYQHLYHALRGTRLDSIPVLHTPGNHEFIKGVFRHLPDSWYATFPAPDNGPIDFLGSTYYVDFPRLRFVSVDTHSLRRLVHYTRLQAWLRAVIEPVHAEGRMVIVQMHHPAFACAPHRYHVLNRLFIEPVLDEADVVFSGHDHLYCRQLPFVVINSSRKSYLPVDSSDDIWAASPKYALVDVYGAEPTDTIRVRTYLLDTCAMYDEFFVSLKDSRQDGR